MQWLAKSFSCLFLPDVHSRYILNGYYIGLAPLVFAIYNSVEFGSLLKGDVLHRTLFQR